MWKILDILIIFELTARILVGFGCFVWLNVVISGVLKAFRALTKTTILMISYMSKFTLKQGCAVRLKLRRTPLEILLFFAFSIQNSDKYSQY